MNGVGSDLLRTWKADERAGATQDGAGAGNRTRRGWRLRVGSVESLRADRPWAGSRKIG
jgi:hypothetical protein